MIETYNEYKDTINESVEVSSQISNLRMCLRTFNGNGTTSRRGFWHIGNGGYDMNWQLTFDDRQGHTCIIEDVSGRVSVGADGDFTEGQLRKILNVIKEELSGYNYDTEKILDKYYNDAE